MLHPRVGQLGASHKFLCAYPQTIFLFFFRGGSPQIILFGGVPNWLKRGYQSRPYSSNRLADIKDLNKKLRNGPQKNDEGVEPTKIWGNLTVKGICPGKIL